MSARGRVLGAITNLPIPAAPAAVKKARRERLPVVLPLASSDIGHSAVKNVSLESRTVRPVSSAGVQWESLLTSYPPGDLKCLSEKRHWELAARLGGEPGGARVNSAHGRHSLFRPGA